MNVGYLYVTSNSVNDTLYVGQSSKMDEHSLTTYLGSGDYFTKAIAEHSVDAFSKTILGYYNDQAELDYAEVHTIARMRAEGLNLYNGGVGGPRAQKPFVRTMFERFGVLPPMCNEWFNAIDANPVEVKEMVAAGSQVPTDDFYRELEAQLLLTQDLSGGCSSCGAAIHTVCRTKTGNPSRNHVARTTKK